MTITQRVVRNARKRGVTVLTRTQWGSAYPDVYRQRRKDTKAGRWGTFLLRARYVAQHITVTFDSGVLVGEFKADCRTIERIGMERFGSGVSYNFLVDMRSGAVGVGQPLDSKGTHTVNDKGVDGYPYDLNMYARAIAVVGMPGDQLSPAAEKSITELIAAMVDEGAVEPGFEYVPHSMFAEKDCPCAPTRDRMPKIRKAVDAAVRSK